MWKSCAKWCLAAGVAGLLTACTESPVAPVPPQDGFTLYASNPSCGGGLDMKTARAPSGTTAEVSLSPGWGQPLSGVTVRATFSGWGYGLPFNVTQMMNFGPGARLGPLPCLEEPGVSYTVQALEIENQIPAPDGVDPNWWAALSPREKRALIKWAEMYMRLHESYRTIGSVIAERFEQQLAGLKARSKIRALDFYGATPQGELLAGAIYGCMLYRNYVSDPYSPYANSEVQEFAASMVAAFSEAQYTSRPMFGLRFGRNGAFGAGLASVDRSGVDCGSLMFQAVGGSISVLVPDEGGTGVPGVPGAPGGEDR